jgi:predicted nucleotidyltransferase
MRILMDIEQLGHLPGKKQRELQRVVRLLFEEFDDALKTKLSEKARRGRIVKVILFGSYARGSWVEDHAGGYFSDYDLLVVVNYNNFGERLKLGNAPVNGSCRS